MKAGDVETVVGHELQHLFRPERVAKGHVQAEHTGLGIGLVNGLAGRREQPRIFLRLAAEVAQVRFIPDLPVIHLSGVAFHRGPGKGAVGVNPFRRAHVVEVGVIGQIAENQHTVPVAVLDQWIVRLPLEAAFGLLDPFPTEILPAPLDTGLLHGLKPRVEIRASGMKGGVDAERRIRPQRFRKWRRRQRDVEGVLRGGFSGGGCLDRKQQQRRQRKQDRFHGGNELWLLWICFPVRRDGCENQSAASAVQVAVAAG